MTAEIIWIAPTERKKLDDEAAAWLAVAEQCVTELVTDQASADRAAHLAKQAREAYNAKEEARKTITQPLLQSKRAADDYFKKMTDPILRIKKHYEQEIARWDLETEQARKAILVQSAAERAVGIVPTTPIPEPVRAESTSVRHRWEPEVVDADLVPHEYCSPDLDKIRKAVWYADTVHKEPQPIPGVKFSIRSITVVR